MKYLRKIVALTIVFLFVFASISCADDNSDSAKKDKTNEIYSKYVQYEVSLGNEPMGYLLWLETIKGAKGDKGDKGLPGDKGEDGVGIEDVKIENGKLYIKYTDEEDFVLIGQVQGSNGENGKDGVGVVDIKIEKGMLKIKYSNSEGYTDIGSIYSEDNIFEEEGASKGLEYTLINGGTEYKISGIGSCADKKIIIPSTFSGKPVKSIGIGAFSFSLINEITIPKSIVSIGQNAFTDCDYLKKVNYAGSVNDWIKINFISAYSNPLSNSASLYVSGVKVTDVGIEQNLGNYVFFGCNSIENVTISNNVLKIGKGILGNCNSLQSITYSGTIESWDNVEKDTLWRENLFNVLFVTCSNGNESIV